MPFVMILFAVLELVVFILVGEWIGFGWAVLLIVLGSLTGLVMLRTNKLHNLEKLQARMAKGELPLESLMQMPFRLFAGFLLMIPGFITDILAILCLIPTTRNHMINWLMNSKFVKKSSTHASSFQTQMHNQHTQSANDDKTIEGEYWEDEKKPGKEDKNEDNS